MQMKVYEGTLHSPKGVFQKEQALESACDRMCSRITIRMTGLMRRKAPEAG